jgi:hypothetical protein
MNRSSANEVKRGQTISFRIPSDTPDHILKQLQRLKETERRNFSGRIAEFVMNGVNNSTYNGDRELVTIPLPKRLNKAQRDWLKHEHSEALLGNIFYHLISDPIRATTLLASLNSNSLDIDEALYLQETASTTGMPDINVGTTFEREEQMEELSSNQSLEDIEDDLNNFDWESARKPEAEQEDDDEELDIDDLLGDFLSAMNK